MGGYWQLVCVCCLLVQSLSAEDSAKGKSTSVVNDNSTSAVNDNSTSAVNDNSTSAVNDNAASVVNDNLTSAVNDNAASAVNDNSTSAVNDNAASAVNDNSTSVVNNNSTSVVNDNAASAVNDNSTSVVNDNAASAVNNNAASVVNDNSTSAVNDNSTSEVNDNSTSAVKTDEELEKNIGQRIASLREMGQDEIRDFSDFALEYFNSQEMLVVTTLEDATVMVEEAIGSMMRLGMTVEKTNCTKKDIKFLSSYSVSSVSDSENGGDLKYCGSLAGEDKEQLECKFDIFKNERSYGEAVVGQDCKPVKVIDRSVLSDPIPN